LSALAVPDPFLTPSCPDIFTTIDPNPETALKKFLVTSALPYANGDIHIGHLVEYIQTDIFVRFLKLTGMSVIYVCASDSHGTPIEINAAKKGISPHELVEHFHHRHLEDFRKFEIQFDEFYTTDSPENRKYSEAIYSKLLERGHIFTKDVDQFFCDSCGRFLPDRFIRGTCPKCGKPDQYGDVCEACGATYRPTELTQPKCALCGSVPSIRTSKHFFFKLSNFSDFLMEWTSDEKRLQPEVRGFVQTWINQGLQDWDISRDGPYFGFKIPGETDKYFYVWLDAPIGYIAATDHYCALHEGSGVEDYWCYGNSETLIHHFIGKDIAYFHTLFWPAVLEGAGYRTPDFVHVHGFLTVDSRKMSKSRGTFITARQFAESVHTWYLRYYYATKMNASIDDLDLNIEEFVNRTNAELVNNITNLISRTIGFLNKRLDSTLGSVPQSTAHLIELVESSVSDAYKDYQSLRFSSVTKHILAVADLANNYIQQNAPWATIKSDGETARNDLTFAVNCIKIITVMLKPILPEYSAKVEKILLCEPLIWDDAKFDMENKRVGIFDKLIERLETTVIDKMLSSAASTTEESAPVIAKTVEIPPFEKEITVDQFGCADLRAGKILSAEAVEGSDKLLKLQVSLGIDTRTVFAGIKSAYEPSSLVGKIVAVVCNLKPRKMRFGISQGMVLAATDPSGNPFVLFIDDSVEPGTRIK
jgi:methionyl-tRNA synthetase